MCSLLPSLEEATVPSGFCAYALPVVIDQARSIRSLGTSEFLALERGSASVVRFFDSDGDGIADSRSTLVTATELNHGIAIHDGYLYASNDKIVYRWPYTSGAEQVSEVEAQEIINNINADGSGGAPYGHTTRTLAFDAAGRLYVSVGSNKNIDDDSFRSRIRRFDFTNTDPFPLNFTAGEVFADGLRNEVGLAFDHFGVLWGVENSADNLIRDDLGGDIHNDNPVSDVVFVEYHFL
jgi:glucose/arabinose dehydrogenase